MTITESAQNKVDQTLNGEGFLGIHLEGGGCSGFKYSVEYANESKQFEETISTKGVTIFVDPAAVMLLVGSTMDWSEDKFSSGFNFSRKRC